MGGMQEEVQGVLQVGKFEGENTMVMTGTGDVQDLQKFLRMNKDKKEKWKITSMPTKNWPISDNLEEIWGVDLNLRGS